MQVSDNVMTVQQFEALLLQDERRLELINGFVEEKMTTEEHGIMAGNIFAHLWNFAKLRKLGPVVMEVHYRAADDDTNVRIPDVAFTKSSERPVAQKGAVPHLPDLAVEVKSPSDSYIKMREKAQYYIENGTQLVWLVFPEKGLVEVYRAGADDIELLSNADTLQGYDVLPEFSLTASDLFEVE